MSSTSTWFPEASITALQIITDALTEIGELAQGESPRENDQTWGLSKLNDLIDTWNAEKIYLYHQTHALHVIAAAQASYTIGRGDGADYDADRPTKILKANWVDAAGFRVPLRILKPEEYLSGSEPAYSSDTPTGIYYQETYPNGTIYFVPAMSGTGGSLEILTRVPLSQFDLVGTVYSFPPGYKAAITLSLAEALCPSYQIEPSPSLVRQAHQARYAIKQLNMRKPPYASDLPGRL